MKVKATAKSGPGNLAAELAEKTGVAESEVVKVLEALGVTPTLTKTPDSMKAKLNLGRVQRAVRVAMEDVMM